MIFQATPLQGAFVIDVETSDDERGFFARTVCMDEFARHGLDGRFVQQSISFNRKAGTLRGLHFQVAPHEEGKLVRVTHGSAFDVIVDVRFGSPTYGQWFGVELSRENRRQVYIPRGMAHGFQTLAAETEMFYEMTAAYHPESARGVRWDDPALAIVWPPCAERIVSERDRALPLLNQLP